MNELKTKLVALTSATALVLTAAFPAAAGISGTASNSGNGAFSDNEAKIEIETGTTVVQENEAYIKNDINLDLNSGHNKANYNTGGDVSITTGPIDGLVSISNSANANFAQVDPCGGCDYDILVENVGNGAESENEAKAEVENTTDIFQDNRAYVKNKTDIDADSGHNKANYNTGDGEATVDIETGPVDTTVLVDNAVNSNHAVVGGNGLALGLGDGDGDGQIVVRNEGNGAFSENEAEAKVETETVIVQENKAKVKNYVDIEADTGRNYAKYNTGGDVGIETGPVDLLVGLDNSLNLNAARAGACCDLDFLAENHKNGADTENESKIEYESLMDVFQFNKGTAKNYVDGDLDTGHNKVNYNTADGTLTGMIDAAVVVETEANTNILGETGFGHFDWGDFGWDFEEMPGGGGFFGWWLWMWFMNN